MKKLLNLLFAILLLVAMNGCKKDPVIPSFNEFGDQAGPELVNGEDYTDAHRGGLSHPDACHDIAVFITDGIEVKYRDEIMQEIDGFVISATDAYRKREGYESLWNWWNVTRSKLIKELKGKDDDIVNDEVVRVLPIFSQMLENKIIPYVIDGICYGGGVRDSWVDLSIQNMFRDTVPYDIDHPNWQPTPYMECYYYFYYYAIDPANYAEAKSMGMSVPSVDSLMVIFPIEEIKQQTDLKEYRKKCVQRYDFTSMDWKPNKTSKVLMYKEEELRLKTMNYERGV